MGRGLHQQEQGQVVGVSEISWQSTGEAKANGGWGTSLWGPPAVWVRARPCLVPACDLGQVLVSGPLFPHL